LGTALHPCRLLKSRWILKLKSAAPDNEKVAPLPPPLAKLAHTPVLRSEMPSGFTRATVSDPADARYHILGAVRIDFRNVRTTESASYALFKDSAQADAFAHVEENIKTGGLFRIAVMPVGRIVVGVTAPTRAQARALLRLALAHLRRSEA
jgi:hypothetical protein